MKVETTRFGEITLKSEQVVHMPHGMLGFPDSQRFVIIQNKADSPFFWYQSLDDPDLAFVITNPYNFVPEYNPQIKEGLSDMAWQTHEKEFLRELEVYVVVNIPRGAPEKITGNFMGPLVVNPLCRQAVQVVLSEGGYSHKTPLFVPLTEKSQKVENEVGV